MHMLTHSMEKAYSCSICLKKYSTEKSVRRHMLVHGAKKSQGAACDEVKNSTECSEAEEAAGDGMDNSTKGCSEEKSEDDKRDER